jgi:serine/threonine protein kinase
MTTPNDSERTVNKGTMPSSARHGAFDEPAHALPAGTRLAEFELLSVVGEGGFGIVYLAHDHSLNRQVAIKEYMPSELAERTQALTVSVRSERHAETFATGLRSFINEARLLAQFDHPCLLKVYRFWESHGTAYMVMPYHPGVTLARSLRQRPAPPDEAWLRDLLRHLLDALDQMHAARCYHRDISPDNILIQPDGRPLLLDFGAARRVIGDMQRAFTVILKTGYAPVEQYGDIPDMPDMKQGPWTDLYALGAVTHFAITGQTPQPAVQRFLSDKYVPLAQLAATQYSQGFLRAIDRTLAVRPRNRPQNAAEMRALLGLAAPAPEPAPAPPAQPPLFAAVHADVTRTAAQADFTRPTRAPPAPLPGGGKGRHRRRAVAGAAVLAAVAASVGLYLWVGSTDPSAIAYEQYRINRSEAARPDGAAVVPPTPDAALAPPAPVALPSVALPSAAPRVATRAPPGASPRERPGPHDQSTLSRPCVDIIQRVSLGEALTPEEREVLKQECGQ